jgi:hypothetical protein
MKLTPEKSATLIEVLKAQSGEGRIADKDAYKAKLADVEDLLDSEKGGVTKEVYNDNKDNVELVEAAKAHVAARKDRDAKAAAKTAEKAEPKKKGEPRTPEQEEASAKKIVAYLNAVSGKGERLSKEDARAFEIATRNYRDKEKGGLTEKAYERFKGFPGVTEASKAHRAFVKKEKSSPSM